MEQQLSELATNFPNFSFLFYFIIFYYFFLSERNFLFKKKNLVKVNFAMCYKLILSRESSNNSIGICGAGNKTLTHQSQLSPFLKEDLGQPIIFYCRLSNWTIRPFLFEWYTGCDVWILQQHPNPPSHENQLGTVQVQHLHESLKWCASCTVCWYRELYPTYA